MMSLTEVDAASFERALNQLYQNQKELLSGFCLISLVPQSPLKLGNFIIGQKNISLGFEEVVDIVDRISRVCLHTDFVTIEGIKYIITSVQETSFYGRNEHLNGGCIICKSNRYVFVAIYKDPIEAVQVVTIVEQFSQNYL